MSGTFLNFIEQKQILHISIAISTAFKALALLFQPAIKPLAWQKIESSSPQTFASSSFRIPHQAFGRLFLFSKLPSSLPKHWTLIFPLESPNKQYKISPEFTSAKSLSSSNKYKCFFHGQNLDNMIAFPEA